VPGYGYTKDRLQSAVACVLLRVKVAEYGRSPLLRLTRIVGGIFGYIIVDGKNPFC
jgi:hypothetical protein